MTDTNSGSLVGRHCLKTGFGLKAKHVEIKEGEETTGTVTNFNTTAETIAGQSAILTGALAGVATEISCWEVHGQGTFENKTELTEMLAHLDGFLHLTNCVVKKPSEKGCKIPEETITTQQLTARTTSAASGEVKPKEGTKIADIKIEGCSIPGLNNTFPVTGALKVQISGATWTSTESQVTTDNTLKFGGVKAGLESALTPEAHSGPGEGTNPLSVT
ncbi:MAG TPA: hypothetical protein VFJ57_09155 [Solirubrobacterales bacterium]|nr:hypothetical protein [Solirubrobacterales bacterium]